MKIAKIKKQAWWLRLREAGNRLYEFPSGLGF